MPVLFRDTVTRQPQYNAPPASGTSLGRLAFAVTAAQLNAQINRATKSYTPYGVGVSSSTDNVIQLRRDLSLQNANTVTFGALLYAPTAPDGGVATRIFGTRGDPEGSGSRRGWEISLDGGTLVEMGLQVFDNSSNRTVTNNAFGISGADVVGKPICLIVEIVRSINTVATGWLNLPGVAELSTTATLASPFGDDTSNNFIELCGKLAATPTNTDYKLLSAWGVQGAVTAKARKDFYDNPWHIFQPPARKLWLSGAASGGTHTTSGAVSGAGATVAGTATHLTLHTTSGTVAGAGATVAGAATHPHTTSGAVTGAGATIAGASDHTTPGGTHTTTGAVSGAGATVAGAATHLTLHATSGAVQGGGATVTGDSAHLTLHTTTGDVAGGGATVAGAASRSGINEARSGVVREWLIQFYEQEWAKPVQVAKAPEPPKKVGALKPAVRAVRNALEPVAEAEKVQKVAPRVVVPRKSVARTAQPAVTTIVQNVLLQAQKAALQDREFVNALNTRQQQQRAAEAEEAEDEELLLLAVL